MIDLEDLYTSELGQAPGPSVVAGAKDDELPNATRDGFAYGAVNGSGAQSDHVRHHARHFEPRAALAFASRALGVSEAALSSLVEEDARGWVVKVRDVREPGIGHGAT